MAINYLFYGLFQQQVLELTVMWKVVRLFQKVEGHERATTEKVSQAGYSPLLPCREVDSFLTGFEHRVMPVRGENGGR